MKNTKKAFTLVELIVVITILAILGTIAFISLQGYSQEAKNSKVTSDLRNITSAIETDSTRNGTLLSDVLTSEITAQELADGTTVNSGALALTWSDNYFVGNIDFAAIGQNGEDFKDPNAADDTDYLFAYVTDASFKAYQVAGQVVINDVKKVSISGTYYKVITTDAEGLIWAASEPLVELANDAVIGWATPTLY